MSSISSITISSAAYIIISSTNKFTFTWAMTVSIPRVVIATVTVVDDFFDALFLVIWGLSFYRLAGE